MPHYQPHTPTIVAPGRFGNATLLREMPMTTPQTREQTAARTSGEPLLGHPGESNPYIDYQFVDLLLSLQCPRSSGYDEMCFIIMGQVKELLFKGLHFELYNAREQIRNDSVHEALEILSRAREYARYITESWDLLSTISTDGFNQFRDFLGTASGQFSFMYRHVEFILGNKNVRLARAHSNVPHVWPAMEQALTSRSLYDEVIALLSRRGFDIAPRALDRDWSEEYRHDDSVEKAWLEVYADPVPANELYRLGEALCALADQLSQYRWRHFLSVEKIIGFKPGTGGSAGVQWLRNVVDHRFFPELWTMRTKM
ncbi:MAG: tryptophan 2,3-dioxygenase [Trinickia sp.]|jgi:tryptophan 2,3-dioxygenase|uniref:tryptophan 2,3-dioxygenase n=1 Tax=Trinickia sp. TaxID=2571163 RepID=UPI003F820A4B